MASRQPTHPSQPCPSSPLGQPCPLNRLGGLVGLVLYLDIALRRAGRGRTQALALDRGRHCQHLRKVITLDPKYARAYLLLSANLMQ